VTIRARMSKESYGIIWHSVRQSEVKQEIVRNSFRKSEKIVRSGGEMTRKLREMPPPQTRLGTGNSATAIIYLHSFQF
jgi:hypothetical protein